MVPFFSKTLSDEDLNDPLKRRMHNDWSYQAVLYRYRLCSECNDEFKELLANPSQLWTAGWGDEEFSYKLERCIYTFFMAGLSVFDSFAYCLYFLGHTTQPTNFPYVARPRKSPGRRLARPSPPLSRRHQSPHFWRAYRAMQNLAPSTNSGTYWVTG